MRFTTLALGIALAVGAVAVAEDRTPAMEPKPEREVSAPAPPPDTAEAHVSWTQRLLPALRRLRLNPGHDYGDRAGALSFRP